MAFRLIPGKGYVQEPESSGLYLVPGKGYVSVEVAAPPDGDDVFFQNQLHPISSGLRPLTAAGLNGVLVT